MVETAHLELRPWTIKQAKRWIGVVHRRLKKIQGAMWAVSVWRGGAVVGCAVVGVPARELMGVDMETLAVLRVAVLEGDKAESGHKGACSMLYGACSRAARAMGARNLVTYTHLDEPGISLKGAGWIDGGMTTGGEWGREGRQRALAIDSEKKRRWWAAWSERAAPEHSRAKCANMFEQGSGCMPGCPYED